MIEVPQYSAGPSIELGRRVSNGSPVTLDDMLPGMIIGPTGSGKTRHHAVPIVNDYPHSAVVLSVKADLLDLTFEQRSRRGHAWVLDPAGVLAGRYQVHGFDLAAMATEFETALDLTAHLIDAGRGGGIAYDPEFWHGMAGTLFAPQLYAGAVHGHGFDQIVQMALSNDYVTARTLIAETKNSLAIRMFEGVSELESRVRDSVQATLLADLKIFNRPSVLASVVGNNFTIPDLFGTDPATLYLMLPGFNAAEIAPMLGLLMTRIMEQAQRRAAGGEPPHPLLLLIDEAAQLSVVRKYLSEWAATARGFGVQLITLWQDLGQLTQRFGPERTTVINNTGAIVFTGSGVDPDSVDYLKRLADSYGLTKSALPPDSRDVIEALGHSWLILHGRRQLDWAANPLALGKSPGFPEFQQNP